MKLKNNVRLLITCDSGAAAGKTTAAKYLSKKFGLHLLTSGLLYRFVSLKLLESKKTTKDITFLKKIFQKKIGST
jgi:cytidylate kinase